MGQGDGEASTGASEELRSERTRESREKLRESLKWIDREKTPVWYAFCELQAHFDPNTVDWANEPEQDARRHISQYLAESRANRVDWCESADLSGAAYRIALRHPEGSAERKEWLDLAWSAAQLSFSEHPDMVHLAILVSDISPIDEDFSNRLLNKLRTRLKDAPYPSVQLAGIAHLCNGLGDTRGAGEALDLAYSKTPDDHLLASFAAHIRQESGDLDGALEVLLDQEKRRDQQPAETSESAFPHARVAASVLLSYQIGECYLRKGDRESALARLRQVWMRATSPDDPASEDCNFIANRCATSLGLLAVQAGDKDEALTWLTESLTAAMSRGRSGYDLRLAAVLVADPSAREVCGMYLEAAITAGPEGVADKARALLAELEAMAN